MKPPRFAYAAPTRLSEVTDLLARHAGDVAILAGGQSLIPALNFRLGAPAVVVDVNRVAELGGIDLSDGVLRIGALARHAELVSSDLVARTLPVFGEAARHIGHGPIRNRGTIGGSIAHADPAAELPAVVAALGGTVELASRTAFRSIPFGEFALGPLMTTKAPDELVTAITVPVIPGLRYGFHEVARRPGDFALAGAVAAVRTEAGAVAHARFALFGLEAVPRRLERIEEAVAGLTVAEAPDAAVAALDAENLDIDETKDGAYRRHLASVVLATAFGRALYEGEAR